MIIAHIFERIYPRPSATSDSGTGRRNGTDTGPDPLAVNPVGVRPFLGAAAVSCAAFVGAFGEGNRAGSPLLALGLACVLTPAAAVTTRGCNHSGAPDE